jgi:hypothetical protein
VSHFFHVAFKVQLSAIATLKTFIVWLLGEIEITVFFLFVAILMVSFHFVMLSFCTRKFSVLSFVC